MAKIKVVSELKISFSEYEANLKKEEKAFAKRVAPKHKEFIQQKTHFVEINLFDDKMDVFKIIKGKNSVLTKRLFGVDKSKIFHVLKISSKGPKKVWVPRCL